MPAGYPAARHRRVGGLLIAGAGFGATYAVDAATFLVSLVALARGWPPG